MRLRVIKCVQYVKRLDEWGSGGREGVGGGGRREVGGSEERRAEGGKCEVGGASVETGEGGRGRVGLTSLKRVRRRSSVRPGPLRPRARRKPWVERASGLRGCVC